MAPMRSVLLELAEGMEATRKVIEAIRPGQSIGIFIGPEGGFTPEEVTLAMEHKVEPKVYGNWS